MEKDEVIASPLPKESGETQEIKPSRKRNFLNTLHIGVLNYKSRPKFTTMMSFALFICAITLFVVLSVFGQSLIKPLTTALDGIGVEGKIIVSDATGQITQDDLDAIRNATGAGFSLIDRELSEFEVSVPKRSGMMKSYTVTCVYAPYKYLLEENEALLVIPLSASGDEETIKAAFLNAGVGIDNIRTEKTLTSDGIYLYLGYDTLMNSGIKIRAVNSTMKLGEFETTVYTFERNEELEEGSVALVNSNYYDIKGKSVIFSVKTNRAYVVVDDSEKQEDVTGMIVQMSSEDYDALFAETVTEAKQACLYFSNDSAAASAVGALPEGYMGLLSTSRVYVQNADDIYAMNIVDYLALIVISLCFGMLISMIFMRSVKIYQTDFAVYRTLGISSKIASRSLYIQMALIFLPTLVLLPIVSLIATAIPVGAIPFISVGNYLFIEAMMLLIVELVAFGFNRSISGQSIRKSLRRGSK